MSNSSASFKSQYTERQAQFYYAMCDSLCMYVYVCNTHTVHDHPPLCLCTSIYLYGYIELFSYLVYMYTESHFYPITRHCPFLMCSCGLSIVTLLLFLSYSDLLFTFLLTLFKSKKADFEEFLRGSSVKKIVPENNHQTLLFFIMAVNHSEGR